MSHYLSEDENECEVDTHVCDSNAECVNKDKSYDCKCNTGYVGDGFSCGDLNECMSGSHKCDTDKTSCLNIIGSYACPCTAGYVGINGNCVDINECAADPCNQDEGFQV